MPYGSGSGDGDGKNREHRKFECLIPFVRCGSGTACGGVADFFPHHGASRAAAAELPQRKVGVVCIHAICFFVFFFGGGWGWEVIGLLSTPTEVSKSRQP